MYLGWALRNLLRPLLRWLAKKLGMKPRKKWDWERELDLKYARNLREPEEEYPLGLAAFILLLVVILIVAGGFFIAKALL